jgi:peptidoglycan/xylan/chitin deacetylase (PgdA/CDA1 family)
VDDPNLTADRGIGRRVRGLARSAIQTGARGPIADGLVGLVEAMAPWRSGRLAIVTYHRVDNPESRPDLMPSLISATPSSLAEQIDALVHHCSPVSLDEVTSALADPRDLPPKAVLITFDDAYADFRTVAWPILRERRVPVTLFVPTAYPGGGDRSFWWDRLWDAVRRASTTAVPGGPAAGLPLGSVAQRSETMARLIGVLKAMDHDEAMEEVDRLVAALLPETGADEASAPEPARPAVLDWHELRELAAEGVTLAPHTRTHPLLDRVPLDRAIHEIATSHADLEREIGPTPRVLAYPSGAHGGDAVEAARRAGMVLAVTTKRGGNDLRNADPLRFRRINIGLRTRPTLVRAQIVWASTVDARRT